MISGFLDILQVGRLNLWLLHNIKTWLFFDTYVKTFEYIKSQRLLVNSVISSFLVLQSRW